MKDFDPLVTPHCHTLSLDSGSTPESFLRRELDLNTGYITTTDHGTLAGVRKIYDLAKKAKITPILGLESYLRPRECEILKSMGVSKTIAEKGPTKDQLSYIDYRKYFHVTMHFKDYEAFQTAARLISIADETAETWGSEKKPIFGWEELEELGSKNVTMGSSCLIGAVQGHLALNRPDIAVKYYEKLRSIVKPGNFIVEVFPHKCDTNWEESLYLINPDGTEKRLHPNKRLLVLDAKGKRHEIDGKTLAKRFKDKQADYRLVGTFRYKVLTEEEPFHFNNIRLVEGFIQNECSPYAPNGAVQIGANQFVIDLAKKYGDPIVVSDDSHVAIPEHVVVQKVRLLQSGNWHFSEGYWRKSSSECFEFFNQNMGIQEDEFRSWVENSRNWASGFKDFKFQDKKSLPAQFYPHDTVKYLFELIRKHGRMDWSNPKYVERLKEEVVLLQKNGVTDFLPYFFTQEEVLSEYEKARLLTGPGRGSAAGVFIAYLLGITHVDPFKDDLSLSRFITPDRIQGGSYPDIDHDLFNRDILDGTEGRPGFLERRFGKNHVAKISTNGTLRLKSAIKDVCRALYGEVSKEVHALTKRMADAPQGVTDQAHVFGYQPKDEDFVPGAIDTDPALKEFVLNYPEAWETAKLALSLVKGKGVHAGGYVITDRDMPISSFLPTMNIDGVTATQWTKDEVEEAGGIKIDFLVIKILEDISKCIEIIQANDPKYLNDHTLNGRRVPGFRLVPDLEGNLHDIWDLPEKDEVFKDILDGKTETVFQLNTSGAKKYLQLFNFQKSNGKMGINSISDIAVFTALDRPGTLDAVVSDGTTSRNMLEEYVARAKGDKPIGLIQELQDISPDTYGVLVFQETASKVFREVGRATSVEAEGFRSHASKKNTEKVLKDKEIFMRGAKDTVGEEVGEKVWEQLVTSSRYSFNKSHACCYAVTAYATAYLKHFYPLQWWCAVLSNSNRNEIQEKFWKYCSSFVLLPDIKYSGSGFIVEGNKLRAPLWLLEGVGEKAYLELTKLGPFTDIKDFLQKIENESIANGTTIEPEVKESKQIDLFSTPNEPPKIKKAHSAINRKVAYNLIISGIADSLFPENMDILSKLQLYEQEKALITGSKQKSIEQKFLKFDALTRYQYRKQLMPYFAGSVLPIMVDSKIQDVTRNEEKRMYVYLDRYPFVNPSYLSMLEDLPVLPNKTTVAVAAVVLEYRLFTYHGTKEAAEYVLDVAGQQIKVVKWPDYNTGELISSFKKDLTGCIVIAVLTKSKKGKDPSLDLINVIREPITQKEE